MFIYNFKVNKKIFLKLFKITTIVLAIILFALTIFSIFEQPTVNNQESKSKQNCITLDSTNYTGFLKDCHENINKYENVNVAITGYVYRMPDFNENQFVIARTMLVNNNQAVVVGMLCESEYAKEYDNYDWITITGTISKGNYKGTIPEIIVKTIKKSEIPEDEFVYEPID